MLQKLNQLEEVAVYLIDYSTGRFLYMSNSVHHLLGYSPGPFYEKGLDFLYSIMHPGDYPRVLREYVRRLHRLEETQAKEQRLHFISTEFRVKNEKHDWFWVENTGAILDFTAYGQPQNSLGFIKKIEIRQGKYQDTNRAEARKILFNNIPPNGLSKLTEHRKLFVEEARNITHLQPLTDISMASEEKINISPREKEILQLIANGYSAREIAGHLFISEATVVSHRKNLLIKFKVKNTAELIKKASKLFWLE